MTLQGLKLNLPARSQDLAVHSPLPATPRQSVFGSQTPRTPSSMPMSLDGFSPRCAAGWLKLNSLKLLARGE